VSGVRGRQRLGLLPVPVDQIPVRRRAESGQVLGVGRERHRTELVRSQVSRRQDLALSQRLQAHATSRMLTATRSNNCAPYWETDGASQNDHQSVSRCP